MIESSDAARRAPRYRLLGRACEVAASDHPRRGLTAAMFTLGLLVAALTAGPRVADAASPPSTSSADSGRMPAAQEASHVNPGTEVVSERTRFSRTYVAKTGRYTTRISEEPLNFSADGGRTWKAVDNRIVADSGQF